MLLTSSASLFASAYQHDVLRFAHRGLSIAAFVSVVSEARTTQTMMVVEMVTQHQEGAGEEPEVEFH